MNLLNASLENFNTTLADLGETETMLSNCAGPADLTLHHSRRITWAREQVAAVQAAAAKIGTIATAARRAGINLPFVEHAERPALLAINGGTALLAAVNFSARHYMETINQPHLPYARGLIGAINWASVGSIMGAVEGIRNEL